jgi:hypothetical protein
MWRLGWECCKQKLNSEVIPTMRSLLSRTLTLSAFAVLFGSSIGFKSVMPVYAGTSLSGEKLLLAQSKPFPLQGSKFTELGDHRRMETSITISKNGRIDGVTRIWTAAKWTGFTGSVAVAITDRAGNRLYVTNPQSWGVDCKRCPGPSNRTQSWADTVPANVLKQVGGYAIIHQTNPRSRWRSWLSDTKEAVGEIKAIYSQF